MKKRGLLTLQLFLICSLVFCQPGVENLTSRFKKDKKNNNLHVYKYIGQEIVKGYTNIGTYRKEVEITGDTKKNLNTLGRIVRNHKRSLEEYDDGMKILGGTIGLTKGAICAGALIDPEPASKTALAITCAASTYVLNKVQDMSYQAGKENLEKKLVTNLRTFFKNKSEADSAKLMNIQDPQEFRNFLAEGSDLIVDIHDLPIDDQKIVDAFTDKMLIDQINNGFNGLFQLESLNSAEIKNANKNIVGLARTFKSFSDSTFKVLNAIVNTQKEIKVRLVTLEDKVGKTQEGVAFLQNYLFGKMSPDEQLVALESGLFQDQMSPTQLDALKEEISIVKKQQDLNKSIATYLNAAGEFLNIAQNLGVSSEITGKISTALDIANIGFDAYTKFQTGDFLGSLSAVSSLFGIGGGRDLVKERHEEIMNAFGVVFEKLDALEERLKDIQKTQNIIIQNQRIIYEQLVTISNQISLNHKQVMDKLQLIHGDILFNRQLINDRIKEEYGLCNLMIVDEGERIIDTKREIYPSFERVTAMSNRLRPSNSINLCFERIKKTRLDDGRINSFFWLETYKDGDNIDKINTHINEVYAPLYDLMSNDISLSSLGESEKFSLLATPVLNAKVLKEKLSAPKDIWNPKFLQTFKTLSKNLLSVEAIERMCNIILDLHFFSAIFEFEGRPSPIKIEKLIKNESINIEAGESYLSEALNIVNIAMIQQSLICGDYTLSLIDTLEKKRNKSIADSLVLDKIYSSIDKNYIIANNYVTYKVYNSVTAGSGLINYHFAYNSSSLFQIKKAIGLDLNYKYFDKDSVDNIGNIIISKGWNVLIKSEFIPLPPPESLVDGDFIFNSDMVKLSELKERLLTELSNYSLFTKTKGKDREMLNLYLLNSF